MECPIMQTCVRATKPLNDQEYVYAEFTYHPNFGCTAYIQRKTQLNNLLLTPNQNPMEIKVSSVKEIDQKAAKTAVGKKRNYPKGRKTGKRRVCAYCDKGFLGRTNQKTCSPECSKKYYVQAVVKTGKKRGRPKKAQTKSNLYAPKTQKLKEPINNMHLVHAVVSSYYDAKLIMALCNTIYPKIDVKIVKL